MSWFEDQIKQRNECDRQLLERSFVQAAECIYGQTTAKEIHDERIIRELAIDEVLKYFGCEPAEIPDEIEDGEEQLDYCLRRYGIMKRIVTLEGKWYKDAFGPLLAFEKETGKPIVLLPDSMSGTHYCYKDPSSGKVRINSGSAEMFDVRAYCFYKPLPHKKLTKKDLLSYINGCMSLSDKRSYVLGVLFAAVISMLLPLIIRTLVADFSVGTENTGMLVSVGVCMMCTVFSVHLIGAVNDNIVNRAKTKTLLNMQSAVMMRLLSLPTSFFRNFSTGELASISSAADELCELLISSVMSVGITAAAGLIYLFHPCFISSELAVTAVVLVLITVGYGIFNAFLHSRISRRQMELAAKESGIRYGIISGIQKIKLSGAEKRFFARWLEQYAKSRKPLFDPPMLIRSNRIITLAITLISNIILFYKASKYGYSQADFLAFMAVFGLLMGSLGKLTEVAAAVGKAKPILEMTEAVMQTEPETSDKKQYVTSLSGSIELNSVYFRYDINSPYLLNNVSLRIRSGEYIAVVGRTGCGKSTLMKLLLGIETPERGGIYYNRTGNDLASLDLSSLRRKIGTVMQNGELFQGSIFENISISAPNITEEDAWAAAETAGIADDIRAMPMGMHTLVSQGQGGISGGQKQRILIARAIAGKPKILMLDEATSALDNKTQRQVSEALDRMGCTRIVIAHRLSTIRHCDRILVLDNGTITEDGNYEQLIEKNGIFAELVKRQRVDI